MELQAYCVKCGEKRTLNPEDTELITMDTGRKALRSKCEVCGTKLTRITSQEDIDEFFGERNQSDDIPF